MTTNNKDSNNLKLSLFHKLSLSILALCLAGMALLWISTRVLFASSFLEYLNTQNERDMQQAVDRLSNYYARHGSWDALAEERYIWRELASGITETPPHRNRPRRQPNEAGPPRRGPGSAKSGLEPGFRRDSNQPPEKFGARPPLPESTLPNKVPSPAPPGQPLDLTLSDNPLAYIAGHGRLMQDPDNMRLPIVVAGETVGFLYGRRHTQITESVDQNFAESLNRSILIVLAFSLACTLIIATMLAANLSRPIKRLSDATRSLSRGNYDIRMATERSDEIGQLAKDFNQLAKTLDANKHSQQRWIADISHELRTPLAILKGELMAIEDGVRQFDSASLTSLINETDRFSRIVNDLYDLSRADAGDLDYQMEVLNLVDVLTDSVDHFSQRYESKGLGLSLTTDIAELRIAADSTRMTQLMTNLLENSLRYTDVPGQTQIRCQKQGASAIVLIEDSAPSVPESALPRIFERLYRVERSRSREHGGGGLGLALCQTIMQAHNGRIDAASSPLGGIQIKIELPMVENE